MLKKPILGVLALALAVGVALAAAASGTGTAQAQAPPPDLGVEVESETLGWVITVRNGGGQTVKRGQIRLTVTPHIPPGPTMLFPRFKVSHLHRTAEELSSLYYHDQPNATLNILNLRPGRSYTVPMGLLRFNSERNLVKVRAEIIDVFPKESETGSWNNVDEGWGLADTAIGTAIGHTSVQVRVSDRFPDPGDSVSFKVSLENNNFERYDRGWNDQNQIRVKVSLSPGMELVRFNPPANTRFDQATGIWHAGTLKGRRTANPRPESKEATVTVKYNGNSPIPAGEHCLTAELVHVIPEEDYRDTDWKIRDNHRHVCLGDDLPVLFQGISNPANRSDLDLFTVYPCVGRTAYPCNQDDTLELVAGMHERGLLQEDIGIGRVDDDLVPGLNNYVILQPESIVLQVGDT